MDASLVALLADRAGALGAAVETALLAQDVPHYRDAHPRVLRDRCDRLVAAFVEAARQGGPQSFEQYVRSIVDERLRSSGSSPTRLAACLLQLAAEHGREHPDGSIAIEIPLTQADLALMIAASRESVAKTLVTWRRQRIVATARRHLTIVDVERLLACCAP